MTEQQKKVLMLRADGLTYDEISKELDCTKQNVEQLLDRAVGEIIGRSHTRIWRECKIIYPNLNKWLIEHNMSISKFARDCGYSNSMPVRNLIIYDKKCNKGVIDAILKVTGMTYEDAFKREEGEKDE